MVKTSFLTSWVSAVSLVALSLGSSLAMAHSDGSDHVHDLNLGTVSLYSNQLTFSNAPAVPIRLVDKYYDSEKALINVYQVAGSPAMGLCESGEAVRYVTVRQQGAGGNSNTLSIDFYSANQVPLRDHEINLDSMSPDELTMVSPCNVISSH